MSIDRVEELRRIMRDITYLDWRWIVGEMGDGYYLQVQFSALDRDERHECEQRGGKFYVSKHVAMNELVRTAHAAIRSAVLHEMDEHFKVEGHAIFDPHVGIPGLVRASIDHEYRKPAPSKG